MGDVDVVFRSRWVPNKKRQGGEHGSDNMTAIMQRLNVLTLHLHRPNKEKRKWHGVTGNVCVLGNGQRALVVCLRFHRHLGVERREQGGTRPSR